MNISLWGIEGLYLIAFVIGVLGISQYLGLHSILPTKKQTTAIIGVVGIFVAGIGAGWWSLQGLTGAGAGVEEGVAPAQIFDAQSLAKSNNITSIDGDTVKVEYSENLSSNTMYAGDVSSDGTELTSIEFTFDAQRVDTNENTDRGVEVSLVDTQVENADDTNSPWDVIVNRSTGEDNCLISVSGSSGYGTHSFLVSPLASKTTTVTMEPNDTALSNIDTYDEITDSIELSPVTNGVDDIVTVKFLKVNEY